MREAKRKPAKRRMLGYHFVAETLRDGRPVPADGEWLTHDGPLSLCESGLHWAKHPADALTYAPTGTRWLCKIEAAGPTKRADDKAVSTKRKILARVEAVPLLTAWARWCALQVIHLWDAPPVVREYLETGKEDIRASAWASARDAAWPSARDAAWASARDAARASAWASARDAARASAWASAGASAWASVWASARDAAWASARDAAGASARASAWASVWASARDAQRNHLGEMVADAFRKGGKRA